jgi:hypothetical protein
MSVKKIISTCLLVITCILEGYMQTEPKNEKFIINDSRFYISWGWNRAWYTKSDIHFTGTDYDFILSDVVAHDRPSKFSVNRYFNPSNISIPQYNFRLGYFINPKYSITLGVDHMKYVLTQDQVVKIDGIINNTKTPYDKTYLNEDLIIKEDFLKFEHTDGLNYINTGMRRMAPFYQYKWLTMQYVLGVEAGILLPKTDATLLNYPRNDYWYLSGYGLSLIQGLNITLGTHFFLQTETKQGYISMPSIRTTPDKSDNAKQDFYFFQYNWSFGGSIKF